MGGSLDSVRVLHAREIGVQSWVASGGRKIEPGGFVKACFARDRGGRTAERESMWVHIGAVFPSGQVAGVLDSESVLFQEIDRGVLILLRPSQILSVLDASTDWLPDLWEEMAPGKSLGDAIDQLFHAFDLDLRAGGSVLSYRVSVAGADEKSALVAAREKALAEVRGRGNVEVECVKATYLGKRVAGFCVRAEEAATF